MQYIRDQELENVIQLPNYGDRRDLVGFTEVFPEVDGICECSHDKRTFEYVSKNFNRERIEWVQEFCKAHTWQESCSCPGDCCGCNCEEKASYTLTDKTPDDR